MVADKSSDAVTKVGTPAAQGRSEAGVGLGGQSARRGAAAGQRRRLNGDYGGGVRFSDRIPPQSEGARRRHLFLRRDREVDVGEIALERVDGACQRRLLARQGGALHLDADVADAVE